MRWVSGSWLLLLACGGAYTRGGTDEDAGGTGSGGTANKPNSGGTTSRGGASSSSRAGSQASAGTAPGIAGGTAVPPTPNRDPQPCFNDTDCPNSACGGEVCNWTKAHPNPIGDKVFVCDPAGLQVKGRDGWCTSDANCKCRGLGASCIAPYCSFTKPTEAPGR
jgi:hypothetical protein